MTEEVENNVDNRLDILEYVREDDVDKVRAFLEAGGEVNICSVQTGRTLLHIACRQGYTEMVRILLSYGANPGATTMRRLSSLHLAAHEGHLKISRFLLEAWAPVDNRDVAGSTPLHLAAKKGHAEIVRLLLQCGADKDWAEQSGWTALHFAVWNGHARVARALLQAGANAKACDRYKSTPLHIACSFGHIESAKVLLESGADSSAKDTKGAFPDHVIGGGYPDDIDPSVAQELSKLVGEHRKRLTGQNDSHFAIEETLNGEEGIAPSLSIIAQADAHSTHRVSLPRVSTWLMLLDTRIGLVSPPVPASSSLECVVESLRAKVCELEHQLTRAARGRSELEAYCEDGNNRIFSAAMRPECVVCQAETKEALLEPCRHLATCITCAGFLQTCPFCASPVDGYKGLESRNVSARMSALEDEATGLRTQLQRFSIRMRELETANRELKLALRQSNVDALVLIEERRMSERHFPPRDRDCEDSDCGSGAEDSNILPALLSASSCCRTDDRNSVAASTSEEVIVSRESSAESPVLGFAAEGAKQEFSGRHDPGWFVESITGSRVQVSLPRDNPNRKGGVCGTLIANDERSSIHVRQATGAHIGGKGKGDSDSVNSLARELRKPFEKMALNCRKENAHSEEGMAKDADAIRRAKQLFRGTEEEQPVDDISHIDRTGIPALKPIGDREGNESTGTNSDELYHAPTRLN